MRTPVTQQLDDLARRLVPFALGVLLVLFGAFPWPVPDYVQIAPSIPIMVVFYWTIVRPELMPNIAAFTIGLLDDILQGTPLGFSALILLVACSLARSQQSHVVGRPFALHWAMFVIVATAVEVMRWALMSAIGPATVDLGTVTLHLFVTVAIYPCVAWLLAWCQRAFLRQA